MVTECKRKEKGLVSVKEAEEVLGKGAKHTPVANITIGYPDFCDEAIKNASKTKITLITHLVLGEMLIRFWEGMLAVEDILRLLRSQQYVSHVILDSQ